MIPDPNERHQCYSVFGLDAQRMANYYDTVVRLEEQLSADLDSTGMAADSACAMGCGILICCLPRLSAFMCCQCLGASIVHAVLTNCE